MNSFFPFNFSVAISLKKKLIRVFRAANSSKRRLYERVALGMFISHFSLSMKVPTDSVEPAFTHPTQTGSYIASRACNMLEKSGCSTGESGWRWREKRACPSVYHPLNWCRWSSFCVATISFASNSIFNNYFDNSYRKISAFSELSEDMSINRFFSDINCTMRQTFRWVATRDLFCLTPRKLFSYMYYIFFLCFFFREVFVSYKTWTKK